jgi:hypothetical protein
MATHADNSVENIIHLSQNSPEPFRQIWHLEAVRIAKTDDGYWLKGLSSEDLRSTEIRSILNLQIFELRDQFLYLIGKRVPERKMPSGVLWHPIQQALKVDLPSFNENLFDVPGKLTVELEVSSQEREIYASIVKKNDLYTYVDSVPQHYYSDLTWCIFGGDQAIMIGSKVLPIVSVRYWKYKRLLLPVGYDFKYDFLKEVLSELQKKEVSNDYWVVDSAGCYFSISEEILIPMSRISVKHTLQEC